MTERTIVALRCDMIPPPGSSARFWWTLESTTMYLAPGGHGGARLSLPPRVSVTFLSST